MCSKHSYIHNTVYVYMFVKLCVQHVGIIPVCYRSFTHRSIDWFEHMKYSINMKNKQL